MALVGAEAEFSNNVLIGARENAENSAADRLHRSYPSPPLTTRRSCGDAATNRLRPARSDPPDSSACRRHGVGSNRCSAAPWSACNMPSLGSSEKLNCDGNYASTSEPDDEFPGIEEFLKKYQRRSRMPAPIRSASTSRRSPMPRCRSSSRRSTAPAASTATSSLSTFTRTRSTRSWACQLQRPASGHRRPIVVKFQGVQGGWNNT